MDYTLSTDLDTQLSGLTALPAELVDEIAAFASCGDDGTGAKALGNLRLTCRALRDKSEWQFYKANFRDLPISLTGGGRARLQEVASHEDARRAVRRFILPADDIQASHFSDWFRDQEGYLDPDDPSNGIAWFRDILANRLVNCATISVVLKRHSPTLFWCRAQSSMGPATFALWLLAAPGARVRRLTIQMGDELLRPIQFDPRLFRSPPFLASWAKLTDLTIAFKYMPYTDEVRASYVRLISLAHGLQSLALYGFSQRGACEMLKALSEADHLGKLRVLRLANMVPVASSTLTKLLTRLCGTVQKVSLVNVDLSSGTWEEVLDALSQVHFPALEEFFIGSCSRTSYKHTSSLRPVPPFPHKLARFCPLRNVSPRPAGLEVCTEPFIVRRYWDHTTGSFIVKALGSSAQCVVSAVRYLGPAGGARPALEAMATSVHTRGPPRLPAAENTERQEFDIEPYMAWMPHTEGMW